MAVIYWMACISDKLCVTWSIFSVLMKFLCLSTYSDTIEILCIYRTEEGLIIMPQAKWMWSHIVICHNASFSSHRISSSWASYHKRLWYATCTILLISICVFGEICYSHKYIIL